MSKAKQYIPGLGKDFTFTADELDLKSIIEELKKLPGSSEGITEEQVQIIVTSAINTALAKYYDKTSADGKFQVKGNYATAGTSYTKAETYTKAEVDKLINDLRTELEPS